MHGCDRRCWRMHRCAWDQGESGFLRKLVSKLGKIINAFFFFFQEERKMSNVLGWYKIQTCRIACQWGRLLEAGSPGQRGHGVGVAVGGWEGGR